MNKSYSKIAAAVGVAVIATAATLTSASAASCNFNTNLRVGSRSSDVMELQKVLNMDSSTMVASTGPGSKGMETSFFGTATRNAVIKFQEKYASEVLTPAGLTKGTGNVFASTRAKLNSVCAGGSTTTTTPTTNNGPVSVSLGGAQPSGVLVAGQAGAKLADLVFSGTGTVTNLELQRTGVSTNNTLTNVYLYDGATRLTDSASVTSDGKIRFNAPQGLFSVAGSKTVSVRADIAGGTNGQSVGVSVNNYVALGSTTATTVSGVMGNNLTIASVATATITVVNNQTGASTPINAGLVNQNVWDANLQVGVRSVSLKGLTFKYIGSAPTDALSNINLYVDGVKVGNTGFINNGMVVFDLMNAPVTMQTGTRLVQLRADIVKGTSRSFQFQIQNSSDYMLEDSNLAGVFVTPTNGTVSGNNFQINNGSLTINQEPSFTDTKVVGGATNATLAKFKVQAFGEDTKVETVQVTPVEVVAFTAAAAITSPRLQNVTLYANGQAVGSSQNWTSGALTFNLGSSFIIPAGATQMLEVKADMRDAGGQAYTGGTVRADVATTLVRGQSSQNTVTNATATGRTLTVSSGTATFARTGGFAGQTISPNSTNVKIGSFTVQASDAEDLRVTNLAINLVFGGGMTATNLTNLKITDSSTTVFNPIAGANNFTMDVVVPKSTSKTFDVTVDLGSAQGGTATVQANASATYRGVNTGTSATATATGVQMIANNANILATDVTKLSSSPSTQLVLGGTANNSIVTFNVKTNGGTGSAVVTDMTFAVSSSDNITKVTVGGKSAVAVGTTVTVSGLALMVPSGAAGVDVPVTVDFGTVAQPGGIASQIGGTGAFDLNGDGDTLDTVAGVVEATAGSFTRLTLTEVKYTSGTNVQTLTGLTTAASPMQLVASKPTLTVPNTTGSGLGNTETKIGEVTVAADAKGNIKVNRFVFDTTVTAGITLSAPRIADGSTTVTSSACAIAAGVVTCDFGTASLTDGDGYSIASGTSKTLSLYATVAGVAGASGTASVSSKLQVGATGISWDDVTGAGTSLTGANIFNYPTGSYSVRN